MCIRDSDSVGRRDAAGHYDLDGPPILRITHVVNDGLVSIRQVRIEARHIGHLSQMLSLPQVDCVYHGRVTWG